MDSREGTDSWSKLMLDTKLARLFSVEANQLDALKSRQHHKADANVNSHDPRTAKTDAVTSHLLTASAK